MIRVNIEGAEIRNLAREVNATPSQIGKAVSRALSRTATTLHKMAKSALAKGLDLRAQKELRDRLKEFKIGSARKVVAGEQSMAAIKIWYGLNDMAISSFKGRPRKNKTGIEFRGVNYRGAFFKKQKNGKIGIFVRDGHGRFPISAVTIPIKDQADVILEDTVFPSAAEIFLHHFESALRSQARGFGR